ncbi:hypothetical protein GCM10023318_18140 [Nocardia callitridis]|uniref:Uncharacterized protein n=1 Tax=Nocardia callitridis TaxID=648753 RepID=A0ABP9K1I7_9NOCA
MIRLFIPEGLLRGKRFDPSVRRPRGVRHDLRNARVVSAQFSSLPELVDASEGTRRVDDEIPWPVRGQGISLCDAVVAEDTSGTCSDLGKDSPAGVAGNRSVVESDHSRNRTEILSPG